MAIEQPRGNWKTLIRATQRRKRRERRQTRGREGGRGAFIYPGRTGRGRLNSGKAPGPDGLPAEAIKEATKVKPELLLKLMNNQLKKAGTPRRDSWKKVKLKMKRGP